MDCVCILRDYKRRVYEMGSLVIVSSESESKTEDAVLALDVIREWW